MHDELFDLLGRHLEAENAHDVEATLATLSLDCVFDDTVLGHFEGHEGAADFYRQWWDAFENDVTPQRLHVVDSSLAIAETRWRGRHIGTFLGCEPTGRTIDVSVAIIAEIRDGLMSAERLYWDGRTLMAQIEGAVVRQG